LTAIEIIDHNLKLLTTIYNMNNFLDLVSPYWSCALYLYETLIKVASDEWSPLQTSFLCPFHKLIFDLRSDVLHITTCSVCWSRNLKRIRNVSVSFYSYLSYTTVNKWIKFSGVYKEMINFDIFFFYPYTIIYNNVSTIFRSDWKECI